MRVAVLGNGALATAFKTITKHEITVFAKPNIDFLNTDSINRYINVIADHEVIINTIGIFNGDSSKILQVNYIAPVFLIQKLVELKYKGKVIMIGSHGATWTSWPGIDHQRLMYNVSKLNLRNYIIGLSQSKLTDAHLCLVDSTKFQSKMSNFTGEAAINVATLIESLVDINSPKILHVETY